MTAFTARCFDFLGLVSAVGRRQLSRSFKTKHSLEFHSCDTSTEPTVMEVLPTPLKVVSLVNERLWSVLPYVSHTVRTIDIFHSILV